MPEIMLICNISNKRTSFSLILWTRVFCRIGIISEVKNVGAFVNNGYLIGFSVCCGVHYNYGPLTIHMQAPWKGKL